MTNSTKKGLSLANFKTKEISNPNNVIAGNGPGETGGNGGGTNTQRPKEKTFLDLLFGR